MINRVLSAFETHDVLEIQYCFENGLVPNQLHNGHPLVFELINMYFRSPQFKKCMQVFVDYGLVFNDIPLLAVLLDDAKMLEVFLSQNPKTIHNTYTLQSTFSPIYKASLLHICAEYNHLFCSKVLIEFGANVNATAGLDENGFGGQTPVFHTVNQHNNNSLDVLKYLTSLGADLNLTIMGIVWGKGYEWETFIPSVNPISYAMMGLLPQFQRTEVQIYEIISILMLAQYNCTYKPTNLPNKYLN